MLLARVTLVRKLVDMMACSLFVLVAGVRMLKISLTDTALTIV